MTVEEMEKALQYGADIVTDCYNEGCNVISSERWVSGIRRLPACG